MLLNRRSICLELCLILALANCQDYETSYEEETEDESGPVDYSKFFSVDSSAPLNFNQDFESQGQAQGPKNPFTNTPTKTLGFITNQEQFPDFASTGHFPIDYFEEAQKTEQQKNEENEEPNYISYNLPVNLEADYSSSDVSKVEKPKKNKKTKQSSIAPYPQATGFVEASTPSPYEKYSFQPNEDKSSAKYLSGLISTVAPFNPAYNKIASTVVPFEAQPSDPVPLKGKNCKRVKKHIPEEHGRSKREAMNCFVCEDLENNAKYTQCSYAVEPEPQNDYQGTSQRYSTAPEGFRHKRFSGDPYEYIRKRSQKEYTEAKDKEADEYKVPDFYSGDDGIEKSFSELQSEEIAKNPANCHKEVSDGMTCTICKDPKTGGNFEQCSYTSEPKEKKYAYVTEKKYDSDSPEESSETKPIVRTTELESNIKNKDKSQKIVKPEKKEEPFEPFSKLESFDLDEYKRPFVLTRTEKPERREETKKSERKEPVEQGYKPHPKKPRKLVDDDPYDIPKHFAESTIKEEKIGKKGLEPVLYGSDSTEETKETDHEPDEYHFRLFPEFSHEESKQAEIVAKGDPSTETTRKDVEEVLAEFSKKDRSACKKAEKNGMTCYLCVDKKGIQHEECMYVSESRPQASHVAYHEVKQLKSPEKQQGEPVEAAASEEIETRVKFVPKERKRKNVKPVKKNKKFVKEPQGSATSNVDDEPQYNTPTEFEVGDEEGAYSAETRPVYSKRLGVKLPVYMIEKSEFEKEFDEFAGIRQ